MHRVVSRAAGLGWQRSGMPSIHITARLTSRHSSLWQRPTLVLASALHGSRQSQGIQRTHMNQYTLVTIV